MAPTLLDIESTSLFADTGMLVCAILRRNGKDRTYFVDSPRKERGVLERLLKGIRSCDCLLTFNGRSFDIPFLLSRGLVLGIDDGGKAPTCHIDLYEQCKRILRFDKLSLDHVARILGIESKAAMSGREVPHMYLTYLSGRDKAVKDKIIEHCRSDVDVIEKLWLKLEPFILQEGIGK